MASDFKQNSKQIMMAENKNSSGLFFGFQKVVCVLVIASLSLGLVMPALILPLPARAQAEIKVIDEEQIAEQAYYSEQQARDMDALNATQKDSNFFLKFWRTWLENRDFSWKTLENAVYIAGKKALHYLLNTMAYDIATWLASGDEGQKPMFFTEGWGEYLLNLVDAAGGEFLESLSSNWGLKFNICDPKFDLKLRIGLGLGEIDRPKKPKCNITQLINNWSKLASDKNFLDKFDDIFDPEKNDVGIAITMFGKYMDYKDNRLLSGVLKRQEGGGYKSVGTAIADKILTPGDLVSKEAEEALRKGTVADENVDYGDIFTYAVGTFINTLASKLLDRFFKEGLANFGRSDSSGSRDTDLSGLADLGRAIGSLFNRPKDQDLYSGQSGLSAFSGQQAAQSRFLDFLEAGIEQIGRYDVLTKLSFCPDAAKPGPDECVLTPQWQTAVERKMTLKEATKSKIINGDAPFGIWDYDAGSLRQGLPYRSIVIMRAYRIVPLSWEIAAQIIHQFEPGKSYSLNDLMGEFKKEGSLYRGLVDPDWVLTLPDHFCNAKGYGPKIIYEGVREGQDKNSDDDYDDKDDIPPTRLVGRGEYCADYQSCISSNADGSCKYYGYCNEERKVWDLQGVNCPVQYNSCQTFQRRDGKVASYLENTLDYNGCSGDNVGCQWYCRAANPVSDAWVCVNEKPTEAERVLKPCSLVSGCPQTITCKLNEGETTCSDPTVQVNLNVSEPCHTGSTWWVTGTCNTNGNGQCLNLGGGRAPVVVNECLGSLASNVSCSIGECDVSASCTIPFGGVSCGIDTCKNLNNLLPNPGFEAASATAVAGNHIADFWYTTDSGKAYFARAAGATEMIYPDGKSKNSLRFFSFGDAEQEYVYSDPVRLPAGNYTFSGYAYDFLNKGGATLTAIVNESTPQQAYTEERSTTKGLGWERVSFNFTVTDSGGGFGYVKLIIRVGGSGEQVGGRIWFDNFQITEECVVNQATLTLIGTVRQDQSKIHLDSDAEACEPEDSGCSEFIRTQYNLGTNLVRNSSFENWDPVQDILPLGWQKGDPAMQGLTVEKYADSPIDRHSVKIKSSAAQSRAFQTMPLPEIKDNTTYRVSFWAKSESSNEDWLAEILSDHSPTDFCSLKPSFACLVDSDCEPYNFGKCLKDFQHLTRGNSDKLKLTSQWQKFVFDSVVTRVSSHNFRLSFGNTSASQPLYLDGVQIEEIERNSNVISNYNDYGAANLTYLKKPPAYLNCQGYTSARPSPDVIEGLENKESCAAEDKVWRKFCSGGDNDGQVCNGLSDCTGLGATCQADSCQGVCQGGDNAGKPCNDNSACTGGGSCEPDKLCCHYIDRPECASYARFCQADEVGCESYTPLKGRQSIPAVVGYEDYCPLECVGYEAYKQSPTFFEDQASLEYFIPQTAKKCSAANNGCTEFTNLDEVASGGEGLYYYKYLRICKKPDESGANCQNFYNWEGSDESGYQLRVYSLDADAIGSPQEAIAYNPSSPDDVNWPQVWCNDKSVGVGLCQGGTSVGVFCNDDSECLGGGTCINKRPVCCDGPEDLEINPFCRELYATNGQIYYRIYDNTKTCSPDCHPFRKTRLGESDLEAEGYCGNSSGSWQNNACIYQAIPSQGAKCSASAASCREFRGNAGANIFTVLYRNFESGSSIGWRFGTPSSDSLNVGGHSLKANGTQPQLFTSRGEGTTACLETETRCASSTSVNCFDLTLGACRLEDPYNHETCLANPGENQCGILSNVLIGGRTYLISFWAKSGTGSAINDVAVKLSGAVDDQTVATTTIALDWNYYEVGPVVLKAEIDAGSQLGFVAPSESNSYSFFIDNVSLKEVNDYVYVIRNSWQTPISCDTNPFLEEPISAPQFMLGCRQYRDSYSRTHNLKSFEKLCREEMVGCEALIDTYNSKSPFSEIFNIGDEASDVKVATDTPIFMVNRPEDQCNSFNKGCQELGLPIIDAEQEVSGYQTVYLINNPDQYSSSLCLNEEVGCQQWQTGDGYAYFKDPGSRICEYRQVADGLNYSWFKYQSTSLEPDCPIVQPPVGKPHPADNWAGVCPAQYSSCTQFIDPVSRAAKNLIYNPDFSKNFDNNTTPDNWSKSGNILNQAIKLKKDKAYTLSFTVNQSHDLSSDPEHFDIKNCPGIVSFDHSMTGLCVDAAGAIVSPRNGCSKNSDCDIDLHQLCSPEILALPEGAYKIENRTGLGQNLSYSGRFMSPVDQTCQLFIGSHNFNEMIGIYEGTDNILNKTAAYLEEVGLRETGVYYTLGNTIDKYSCNGQVNPEVGCILFNDRSAVSYKQGEDDNTYLGFDADVSRADINGGVPVIECAGVCDANAVLKAKPDRTCESWLSCTSYATTVDEAGAEQKHCLSTALCDSLNEAGQCDHYVELAKGDSRYYYYTEPEMINNLSGYAKAGYAVGGDKVSGYFNYAEMTQEGGSASISNGNFDSVFASGKEPLGWREYIASGQYDDTRGWMPHKFSIETDYKNSLEGGYLQLNTSYQAKSEEVDLERNNDYILSGWINTAELRHMDLEEPDLKAQICYEISDMASCQRDDNDEDSLCCPSDLAVKADLDWTYVTYKFNSAESNKLTLVLKNNSSDISSCRDQNLNNTCGISGYSLFDEIKINPVLKVSNEFGQRNFVSPTCRVYPNYDSLSCKYFEKDILYQGISGYCLTADPQNHKQCVQWWPVDQIKGELANEVVPYQIQSPLFYCVETGTKQAFESSTVLGSFTTASLPGSFTDIHGFQTSLIPFDINEDYRPMFRYPYVDDFQLKVGIANLPPMLGLLTTDASGAITLLVLNFFEDANIETREPLNLPINHEGNIGFGFVPYLLEIDVDAAWLLPFIGIHYTGYVDFLGAIGFNTGINLISLNFYDIIKFDFNDTVTGGAKEKIADLRNQTNIASFLIAIVGGVIGAQGGTETDVVAGVATGENVVSAKFGPLVGIKIATEQDPVYGTITNDPIPGIPMDIYGGAVVLVSEGDEGADLNLIGNFTAEGLEVNYCKKLVQVVTSSGTNKAWSGRVFPGSKYILSDQGSKNDSYLYYNPFSYDEFLANVKRTIDAGQPADQYTYQSSDYEPFGSIVPPPTSQYPENWDSRETSYRQPLFYEPPLTSLGAPYQARMGENHQINGNFNPLQQIFLKSYGIWQWQENTTIDPLGEFAHDDGYYEVEGNWDLFDTWLEYDGYCGGDTSNGRQRQPCINFGQCDYGENREACINQVKICLNNTCCRVRPIVETFSIFVNDKPNTTVIGTGLVKLDFTVKVDPNQLPLSSYSIKWGDEISTVTGVALRSRSNPDNPFTLYHAYDYWQIKRACAESVANCDVSATCNGGQYLCCPQNKDYCQAKVRIKVKDNWNAETCKGVNQDCNTPAEADNSYIPMNGWITIKRQ